MVSLYRFQRSKPNWNKSPSGLLASVVCLRENYESMDKSLHLVKYSEHKWNICGNLKVCFLNGKWGIQIQCFLCIWNNRNIKPHYVEIVIDLLKKTLGQECLWKCIFSTFFLTTFSPDLDGCKRWAWRTVSSGDQRTRNLLLW